MSWLFGIKTPQIPTQGSPSPPSDDSSRPPSGGDSQSDKKNNTPAHNSETQYRFDSAALERAAKAAKELEKSGNAKELLALSRSQEVTKQMEIEKQIKEMQTYQEELKANASQKLAEEKRKLLDEETRHNMEVGSSVVNLDS